MTGPPPDFDLQSHSLYSDGELAPAEVVAGAAAAGVGLLSLTDHDTVDGVAEAARAAEVAGIRLVNGVEISAIDPVHGDLHILGYGVRIDEPGLQAALAEFRGQRARRADEMEQALRELGFAVATGELRERRAAGESIGRPHLARAAVAHPANAERLAREGCGDPSAFLERYLIPGTPGFRPRTGPTVRASIETIHAAGGVAVWAHPFWDVPAPGEVGEAIERFAGEALDGVECFYITHDRQQTRFAVQCCERLGLLRTGSADFHGPGHRKFRRFRAFELYGMTPELGPLAG